MCLKWQKLALTIFCISNGKDSVLSDMPIRLTAILTLIQLGCQTYDLPQRVTTRKTKQWQRQELVGFPCIAEELCSTNLRYPTSDTNVVYRFLVGLLYCVLYFKTYMTYILKTIIPKKKQVREAFHMTVTLCMFHVSSLQNVLSIFFIIQMHLIKLEYCFYWQLLREMQINTFGTLYSHFVPYHAHCVCSHLRLWHRMSEWFAVELDSLVSKN